MSNISIIGTGNMARTIGTLAVAGGNTVEVMGRDQSKAADLAKALGGGATTGEWGTTPAGDIVIVAVLYDSVVPVVAEYADALAGKAIVDISNPFNAEADGLATREDTSIAQEAAKAAPASASVFKAFNTIFRHVLEKGRPDVFIAGDNAQAKASVEAFIESLVRQPYFGSCCEHERGRWSGGASLSAVLYGRWRLLALQSRSAGRGSKPPRAALAEDRCGERRGKRRDWIASGEVREDERWVRALCR